MLTARYEFDSSVELALHKYRFDIDQIYGLLSSAFYCTRNSNRDTCNFWLDQSCESGFFRQSQSILSEFVIDNWLRRRDICSSYDSLHPYLVIVYYFEKVLGVGPLDRLIKFIGYEQYSDIIEQHGYGHKLKHWTFCPRHQERRLIFAYRKRPILCRDSYLSKFFRAWLSPDMSGLADFYQALSEAGAQVQALDVEFKYQPSEPNTP